MTNVVDADLWREAYPGEPMARRVRRIAKATGWSVQDVATKLGLNRTGPSTEKAAEHARYDASAWGRWAAEAAAARARAEREAEEAAARRSEELWKKAQREAAAWQARRERVNGGAGRGNPKIDRDRLFRLQSAGLGVRAIARELGCSHVAVIKILRTSGNQYGAPTSSR